MKLRFWGVRGAVPAPGNAFLRYGGNTCCIALHATDDTLVVLDAGTGFCSLGDELARGPLGQGRGTLPLLISCTYWDHLLGLPFPALVHIPGNQLTLYGPDSPHGSLETVYNSLLSPVYSPVYGLQHIGATHTFHSITTEPFSIGPLDIQAVPIAVYPPAAPIWAYRVEEQNRSVVYITDACYTDATARADAVAIARDADVLIHGASYLRNELSPTEDHCRVEDVVEVAHAAGAKQLLLFRHAPTRSDDEIDALIAHCRTALLDAHSLLSIEAAREGPLLDV